MIPAIAADCDRDMRSVWSCPYYAEPGSPHGRVGEGDHELAAWTFQLRRPKHAPSRDESERADSWGECSVMHVDWLGLFGGDSRSIVSTSTLRSPLPRADPTGSNAPLLRSTPLSSAWNVALRPTLRARCMHPRSAYTSKRVRRSEQALWPFSPSPYPMFWCSALVRLRSIQRSRVPD